MKAWVSSARILSRSAQCFAISPLERKVRQRNHRFLAELEECEAEVDVNREMSGADLVEHRPAPVPVGGFTEPPRQLGSFALDPQRIAEGDPAAAGDAVHDHALAGIAEEKRLVTEHGQVADRFRRWRSYASRSIELPKRRYLRLRLGVAQLARQREEHQRAQNADHCPQWPRRVSASAELEPYRAGEMNVSVREKGEPRGNDSDYDDGGNPSLAEWLAHDRCFPVENAPRRYQRGKDKRERKSLFPVEPLQQRCHDADREYGDRETVCRVQPAPDRPGENYQCGSGDARGEVGELDDPERQNGVERW
jgi:hypothetical protein